MLLGSVVDQDVDATKGVDRLPHHRVAERRVADIARDRQTAGAGILDGVAGRLGVLVFVEINDNDVSTFLGEADRSRTADAAVATGNHGDFAAQLTAPHIRLGERLWCLLHISFNPRLR